MTTKPSGRRIMMEELKRLAALARGGRYFVKRGYINWANWDFDAHPFAMALYLDEYTLFGSNGMNDGSVSIECFVRIPEATENAQINDAVIDELSADVSWLIENLAAARWKEDPAFPVVFKIIPSSAKAVESHDAQLRIQGVTAVFEATF